MEKYLARLMSYVLGWAGPLRAWRVGDPSTSLKLEVKMPGAPIQLCIPAHSLTECVPPQALT